MCEVPRSARDDKAQRAFYFPAMEKRQFGKTDMQVSVLGFGASEIGYEEASQSTVERLLKGALDAGLNRQRH